MKRRELLEIIASYGAVFVREGGSHTVYENPRTGTNLIIPRHQEISEGTARQIIKIARQS